MRLARRRVEDAIPRAIRQIEESLAEPFVEILESDDDTRDAIADGRFP